MEEETCVVISEVREELEDTKCACRSEIWVESDDRAETADVREDIEERRE